LFRVSLRPCLSARAASTLVEVEARASWDTPALAPTCGEGAAGGAVGVAAPEGGCAGGEHGWRRRGEEWWVRDPGDAVGQHRTHARRRSARKHPPTTAQPRSTPTHRLHGVHHLVLVLGGGVDRLVDVLRRGSGRKLRSRSGRQAGRRPAGGCMPQRCVPGPPRRPRACSLFSGSLRNQRSCNNRAAIVQRTVDGGPRAAHSRLQHHRHSGSNFAASAQYRQAPGSNVRPQHQDHLQTGLTVLLPTQPILLLCVWWWEQE
jgi:hypothetical protein